MSIYRNQGVFANIFVPAPWFMLASSEKGGIYAINGKGDAKRELLEYDYAKDTWIDLVPGGVSCQTNCLLL
jgi:hypothetical protein